MNAQWSDIIADLPPGLSASEAARKLGKPYLIVRYHLRRAGYKLADGRKERKPGSAASCRVPWADVDWNMRDAHIAKKFGVSRESVRQMRIRTGHVTAPIPLEHIVD